MLVCHCRAVNERRIREEIERGARDEFDIADACGAGSGCGGCVTVVSEILAEYGCAPRCPVAGALRGDASPSTAAVAPPARPVRVDSTPPQP